MNTKMSPNRFETSEISKEISGIQGVKQIQLGARGASSAKKTKTNSKKQQTNNASIPREKHDLQNGYSQLKIP